MADKTKVFLSWSGTRSEQVALALKGWLPMVVQSVDAWMSASDIDAGQRWNAQITQQLSETSIGILCLTRDNLTAPWILFEAGALAKSLTEGSAIPYLLDVDFQDITGPLTQFQAKKADRDSTLEMVRTINRKTPSPVPDPVLEHLFGLTWKELEDQLKAIPKTSTTAPLRRQEDVLEELVETIRGMDRRLSQIGRLQEQEVRARRNDEQRERTQRRLRESSAPVLGNVPMPPLQYSVSWPLSSEDREQLGAEELYRAVQERMRGIYDKENLRNAIREVAADLNLREDYVERIVRELVTDASPSGDDTSESMP